MHDAVHHYLGHPGGCFLFLLPDHGINGIVGIYLRIYH